MLRVTSLIGFGAILAAAGAGLSGFGYWMGGSKSGVGPTNLVDKFNWVTEACTSGTVLSTDRQVLAGAGNLTVGIAAGGFSNTSGTQLSTTEKYTYSGDVRTMGTALGVARDQHIAAGNATVGIFAGGFGAPVSYPALSSTDKYTYSGDVRVAGTALGTTRQAASAVGNATVGIFAAGNTNSGVSAIATSLTTDKYTYGTDARVAGTSLSAARQYHASIGNITYGMFCGGASAGGAGSNQTSVYNYTYSGDVVSAGISLTAASQFGSTGTGNATYGLLGGSASNSVSEKFEFALTTWTNTTQLPSSDTGNRPAATSSSPGWF